MMSPLRILYLEDNSTDKELIEHVLKRGGLNCRLTHARDAHSYREAICHGTFDLILSDFSIPGFDGFEACDLARKIAPDVPFILLSGTLSEEQAVEIIRHGAVDYIIKERLSRLVPAIARAIAEAEQTRGKKKAEALLAAQTEYLRSVLNTAAAAIVAMTPEAIIHDWNQEAEKIFGYSRDEVIGRNYLQTFIPSERRECCQEELSKAASGIPLKNFDSAILTKSGSERIICWSAMRLDGTSPLIIGVGIDVTEERKRQAAYHRAQRLDTLGSLAAGIAHDLNNVLAPVMMGVDLLNDCGPGENHKILSIIKSSAQRGSEMVSQILSFGRGTNVVSQLELPAIVGAMIKFARQIFPETIKVEAKLDSTIFPVEGNATELHQVLLNLCVNARDAMKEGGVLAITCQNLVEGKFPPPHASLKAAQQVLITVMDTGPGIAPEVLPRIFEPFFTTKPEGMGTGLGLPTVRNIIRAHGGHIEVESSPGNGATFKIYLPAAAAGKVQVAESFEDTETVIGHGEIIICVDNEEAVLEMVKQTLASYGYAPLTFSSGVTAFAAVQSGVKPSLLITDMRVPIMNGEAIIRLMRTVFPELRSILISGSGPLEIDLVNDLQLSAYLKKPFTTADLLRTVKETLAKPPPSLKRIKRAGLK